jgi:hypothetical protein
MTRITTTKKKKMIIRTIFVIFFFVFLAEAKNRLICDKNNAFKYKYRAQALSFGGNNSKNTTSNAQSSVVTADVILTCRQSFEVQGGKKVNIFFAQFINIRTQDRKPSAKVGWRMQRNNEAGGYVNLDKYFAKPTAFLTNDDGNILKIYSDKKEEAWTKHMKKGIIDMFTTKLSGTVREDNGMMGKHISVYKRIKDSNGNLRITRTWNQHDYTKPRFNPRETTVKGEASVIIKNGRIIMATTGRKVIMGVQPKKHRIFEKERKLLGLIEEQHVIHGSFTDTTSGAALVLNEVTPYNPKRHGKLENFFKGVIVKNEEQGDQFLTLDDVSQMIFDKSPILQAHDHIQPHGLGFENDMARHMRRIRGKELKKSTNLVEDLLALYSDPENAALRAKLSVYASHFTNSSLTAVVAAYKVAAKRNNVDFMKALQSLMASIGTPAAQEALLKTLTSSELIHHFLVIAISIKKPTDALLIKIRSLQQGTNNIMSDAEEDKTIKNMAYLVAPDVASRSKNNALKQMIISDIVDKLYHEKQPEDMLIHLHALGNAKTATPIEYWRRMLSNKNLPQQIQSMIIQGLEHRVQKGYDDVQVSRLLQDIVSSDSFDSSIKATAVSVQSKRHHHLGYSSSMYHFGSIYHESDEQVQHEIKKYLYGVGDKRAAYIMSLLINNIDIAEELKDNMRNVMMSDARFLRRTFRRIGNAFRRAGRSIGDIARKAARGVTKVVRKAGGGINKAARNLGRSVGNAARAVGKGVAKGAKNVAKGAKKAGKAVVKAVKFIGSLPAKVFNAFKKLKKAFTTAQFKNAKTCVPASQDPNDNICVYDNDLAQFVQGQGALSNLKWVKHFEFEKLLGAEVVHLYVGMVGYAGTRFSCRDARPGVFEFSTFAMGQAYARIFSKNVKLITAQASFSKLVDTPARNDAYVKIAGVVLFNRNILPSGVTDILDYCSSKTTSLVKKSFPELVNIRFFFVLVVFPVEFGMGVSADFGVDATMSLCVGRQEASVSVEPYLRVGVHGYGSLSVVFAKGGINLRADTNYRLIPKLSLVKCAICAELEHDITPITMTVDGFINFIGKKWQKDLFSFGAKPISGTLFKKCLTLAR